MKHIQQRAEKDCTIACIAMLAGVSYERVLESVPQDASEYGLRTGEVVPALKRITGNIYSVAECHAVQLEHFNSPVFPSMLRVEIPVENVMFTHSVVIGDGEFYDPKRNRAMPMDVARSTYGHWRVKELIQQVRFNEFS